jgi:hypothetical protein
MATIAIELEADELDAVVGLIGKYVSRWQPEKSDPLARAEFKLDSALLAYEENGVAHGE